MLNRSLSYWVRFKWTQPINTGRRNLTPIQKIAITEKYRPIYEKQAKENQRLASGGDRKSDEYKRENPT